MRAKSYEQAVDVLSDQDLVAPVYFTLCGKDRGQGCVLTRDRNTLLDRKNLTNKGYLCQTNIDHWKSDQDAARDNIIWSIERRAFVAKNVELCSDPDQVVEMMGHSPINNQETIYLSAMIPLLRVHETYVNRV